PWPVRPIAASVSTTRRAWPEQYWSDGGRRRGTGSTSAGGGSASAGQRGLLYFRGSPFDPCTGQTGAAHGAFACNGEFTLGPMKRVLLTGMSGTGKSSVVDRLVTLGYRAVDLDGPLWSTYDDSGDWIWQEDRVRALLDDETGDLLFV